VYQIKVRRLVINKVNKQTCKHTVTKIKMRKIAKMGFETTRFAYLSF
jgi:hypothetical protein